MYVVLSGKVQIIVDEARRIVVKELERGGLYDLYMRAMRVLCCSSLPEAYAFSP